MAGIALIGPNQADSTEQSNLALVLSRALPRKQILCQCQTNHLTSLQNWDFVSEGRSRQKRFNAVPTSLPTAAAILLREEIVQLCFSNLVSVIKLILQNQLMFGYLCFRTYIYRKGTQRAFCYCVS